tara:strand:- start:2773 stop:4053 length:1281 start_codon:yes stop_codon:yes gene_type:complete
MAQQNIIIGTQDAKQGDNLFTAFTKTQANFTELYAGLSAQPQNVIVINQESDFPTQDATTITLDANTRFFIGSQFSTSKSFTVLTGADISSIGPFSLSVIYTGTGVMFNSSVASWSMAGLGYSCTNGTIFGCAGVGNLLSMVDSVCVSSANVGSFTDISPIMSNSGFLSITGQGITLAGSINTVSIIRMLHQSTNSAHVAVDLGTATIDNLEISNFEPEAPLGSVAIKGLANSANINTNRLAVVSLSTLNGGGMVATSGVLKNDIRWNFTGNSGIGNTQNAGDLYLSGGSETITVGGAGNWYEIGTPSVATWVGEIADRFIINSAGYLEYIGERDIDIAIEGRATVEKSGGGSDVLECRIAKNWTGATTDAGLEKTRAQTQNTSPTTVPIGGLVSASTGDNFRVIFANLTSPSDIIATVTSLEASG